MYVYLYFKQELLVYKHCVKREADTTTSAKEKEFIGSSEVMSSYKSTVSKDEFRYSTFNYLFRPQTIDLWVRFFPPIVAKSPEPLVPQNVSPINICRNKQGI